MKRFVFGVTALFVATAAFAACSTPSNPIPVTPPDSGAVADTGVVKLDAGPKDTGVAPVSCGKPVTAADFTAPYKPAKPRVVGACTAAQVTAIKAIKTNAELLAAIDTPSCKACVTSLSTEPTAAPIIVDAQGAIVGINRGACPENATGSAACGKFLVQLNDCGPIACRSCRAADREACQTEAYVVDPAGICREAEANNLFGECPAALAPKTSVCGQSLLTGIEYLCGPGTVADAGADGGDGGDAN